MSTQAEVGMMAVRVEETAASSVWVGDGRQGTKTAGPKQWVWAC